MSFLEKFGWNSRLESDFAPHAEGRAAGRVVREEKQGYLVATEGGEAFSEVSGRLRHEAASRMELAAVGDWVVLRPGAGGGAAVVVDVLPRSSAVVRKAAGPGARPQVLAANVDVMLVTMALNGDLNERRLERYLALAYESGIAPVVVLTKADLCADLPGAEAAIASVAGGASVVAISATARTGLDALCLQLPPRRTAVLVGSSGVGKSTLVNALMGRDVQVVREIGSDDRGRHATTRRDLFLLPSGALLLDTPGMRELSLWDGDGTAAAFAEIEELAGNCRFRDCAHGSEPDCAVREAIKNGSIDEERMKNREKLLREQAYLERQKDSNLQREEKERWKKLNDQGWERSRAKRRPIRQ